MATIRIIVRVPNEKRKCYFVSFNGRTMTRDTSSVVYRWVERKIKSLSHSLASQVRHKTALSVRYGDGSLNETESQDPRELLYALASFLEDYLPKRTFEKKCIKYGENGRR